MKILYVGTLTQYDSALYRAWALERLGQQVIPFDVTSQKTSSLLGKVEFRLSAGPGVWQFNRDLLRAAAQHRPDVMWGDKLLYMQPSTLKKLRSMGIALVNYTIDNPFGPRKDPGWRLYMQCIPFYDLHIVQRDQNVLDYKQRGARDVLKIQTAYEPTLHFPPPPGWSDKDRDRQVSFIGTPYDNRADFLTRLWRDHGLPLVISGPLVWKDALSPETFQALYRGRGELFLDAYRESIWRSKINLSFLTHSNCDEFAHKSFEIAGCGGFLLAERSQGHSGRFLEGEEAAFFDDIEECAAMCRRYLADETARESIARAGHQRAVRDGYNNDGQVKAILERLATIVASAKPPSESGQ
ncbi:MAG: CgeB family protein [Acidobacteriaceae bacterium]